MVTMAQLHSLAPLHLFVSILAVLIPLTAAVSLGPFSHRDKPDVYIIGLPGTSSYAAAKALTYIGYTRTDFNGNVLYGLPKSMNRLEIKRMIEYCIAGGSLAGTADYEDYANEDPSARFILTTRKDEWAWLKTIKKQVTSLKGAYGGDAGSARKEILVREYRDYNAAANEFFNATGSGLEGRFLELGSDDSSAEKWGELCVFLLGGCERVVPGEPFPGAGILEVWREKGAQEMVLHLGKRAMMRAVDLLGYLTAAMS